MDINQHNSDSTSGPNGPRQSITGVPVPLSEQLALPLTESEQMESWKQLSALHPGNRFRLMFGMPLLPQSPPNGKSH